MSRFALQRELRKAKRLLLLIVICMSTFGCAGFDTVSHYCVREPLEFCLRKDRYMAYRRARKLANKVWQEVLLADPSCRHLPSAHAARGFKDGFVDYVVLGGDGTPPVLPPRRYWRNEFQSPCGQQAIDDWFLGFSAGAEVAMKRGYRNVLAIPAIADAGNCQPLAEQTKCVEPSARADNPAKTYAQPEVAQTPPIRDVAKNSADRLGNASPPRRPSLKLTPSKNDRRRQEKIAQTSWVSNVSVSAESSGNRTAASTILASRDSFENDSIDNNIGETNKSRSPRPIVIASNNDLRLQGEVGLTTWSNLPAPSFERVDGGEEATAMLSSYAGARDSREADADAKTELRCPVPSLTSLRNDERRDQDVSLTSWTNMHGMAEKMCEEGPIVFGDNGSQLP